MANNQLSKEWMEFMAWKYHSQRAVIDHLIARLEFEKEQMAKACSHIQALLQEHGAMTVDVGGRMWIVTPQSNYPGFEFHPVDTTLTDGKEKTD